MNIEDLREYCLKKPGATECFPFDEETLVFKVMGKIFALMNLEGELSINLKCEPERAVVLREQYSFVAPGYHMNKKHWNTLFLNDNVPIKLVHELIDHSYTLIINSLSNKLKNEIKSIIDERN